MPDPDDIFMRESAGEDRLALIVSSYERLTGRKLVDTTIDYRDALWYSKRVVLAHGTQGDPVFFYANMAGLSLFDAKAKNFVQTPSRHSAEPVEQSERDRLFQQVQKHNYIEDYAGVRITFPRGHRLRRRFSIQKATVWNLIDDQNVIHGQAATFDSWVWLDEADQRIRD